jgi:hypothetical protein
MAILNLIIQSADLCLFADGTLSIDQREDEETVISETDNRMSEAIKSNLKCGKGDAYANAVFCEIGSIWLRL